MKTKEMSLPQAWRFMGKVFERFAVTGRSAADGDQTRYGLCNLARVSGFNDEVYSVINRTLSLTIESVIDSNGLRALTPAGPGSKASWMQFFGPFTGDQYGRFTPAQVRRAAFDRAMFCYLMAEVQKRGEDETLNSEEFYHGP